MAEINLGAKPSQLGHVGFGTSKFEEMKDWWKIALGARVVHQNDDIAFLSYDDEPTRVAIVRQPGVQSAGTRGPATHVAFGFFCLGDLLGRYEVLRDVGIRPYLALRHRPTTSLYFRDPDENTLELFVPNYRSVERQVESFGEPASRGTFDPDSAAERFRRGESEESILNPT